MPQSNRGMREQRKIRFSGRISSVQVRSTVWRYITHNRTHREIGYNIFLHGVVQDEKGLPENPDEESDFSVAISEKQMQKLHPHIGDVIQGTGWTTLYPENEYADYYRTGALKKIEAGNALSAAGPPWRTDVPDLETYAWRGARQLDVRCYKGKCFQCKWAAMSNVAIEYNWDTGLQKHRFESFCYGPKCCKFYKMGKARAVPCKGMDTAYDTGDLDEIITDHRGAYD